MTIIWSFNIVNTTTRIIINARLAEMAYEKISNINLVMVVRIVIYIICILQ